MTATTKTDNSTEQQQEQGYEWVALSVTTLGALLAALQGSALLIALPDIMGQLHASFLTIMWILLGYLLITTATVPVVGRLADMFGRKNLYNAGFLIFTIGSLLAGLAQTQFHGIDVLVFRMIQGLGGALLLANSTAIVTDAFRRGNVGLGLGVNQIAAAAGFVLGPVLGGLLTALSWRYVFLINVPLGIFGTLWGIKRLREPALRPERHRAASENQAAPRGRGLLAGRDRRASRDRRHARATQQPVPRHRRPPGPAASHR